jgi:hypothetical protein
MAEPARHLHVVDTASGEVLPGCPDCAVKNDEIAGLERDVRGWAARYAQLRRDKAQEAREHPKWPEAQWLFSLWRKLCNHPRAEWTPDRFWLVEPHLAKDGLVTCERAIHGIAFDCFKTKRRNGSVQRHDSWELLFRDRGKVEEMANRAPRGWVSAAQDATIGGPSCGRGGAVNAPRPDAPAQDKASR